MAKSEKYFTRVDGEVLKKFKEKAIEYGKTHSDLIRELMVAVTEDRVSITPTEEQQKTLDMTRGLYNVDRK